jgi:hypothetical protein
MPTIGQWGASSAQGHLRKCGLQRGVKTSSAQGHLRKCGLWPGAKTRTDRNGSGLSSSLAFSFYWDVVAVHRLPANTSPTAIKSSAEVTRGYAISARTPGWTRA